MCVIQIVCLHWWLFSIPENWTAAKKKLAQLRTDTIFFRHALVSLLRRVSKDTLRVIMAMENILRWWMIFPLRLRFIQGFPFLTTGVYWITIYYNVSREGWFVLDIERQALFISCCDAAADVDGVDVAAGFDSCMLNIITTYHNFYGELAASELTWTQWMCVQNGFSLGTSRFFWQQIAQTSSELDPSTGDFDTMSGPHMTMEPWHPTATACPSQETMHWYNLV